MSIVDVVIDPGHGGADNGASHGCIDEDDVNLAIGYYLEYELKDAGISYYSTREKDEYVSLQQRVKMANAKGAKLFLSIHCDAFHKTTAHGMTVHINPAAVTMDTLRIANIVNKQLLTHFPFHRNRGVKRSNFYVLRETAKVNMPAILVECEFLSNPDTRKFLKEPENQRRMARCFKRSIQIFLRDS